MNLQSKNISLWLMSIFYIVAGINHFRDPGFYLPLIPDYLPYPEAINIISGIAEVMLGTGLLIRPLRKWAASLILLMLILFIPSHVHFILIGSCVEGGLCVPEWIGWIRLIIIHPLLILWAWGNRIDK